jgi:hypothetical protein
MYFFWLQVQNRSRSIDILKKNLMSMRGRKNLLLTWEGPIYDKHRSSDQRDYFSTEYNSPSMKTRKRKLSEDIPLELSAGISHALD